MIEKRSGCVDCGSPCMGHACPNYQIKVYICDNCGNEVEPNELYDIDAGQFCGQCVLEHLPTVG